MLVEYSVIVALTGLPIGYSVIVALTGLPIGYSVIVALTDLPIGNSVIVTLTDLPIGYSVIVALTGLPTISLLANLFCTSILHMCIIFNEITNKVIRYNVFIGLTQGNATGTRGPWFLRGSLKKDNRTCRIHEHSEA